MDNEFSYPEEGSIKIQVFIFYRRFWYIVITKIEVFPKGFTIWHEIRTHLQL